MKKRLQIKSKSLTAVSLIISMLFISVSPAKAALSEHEFIFEDEGWKDEGWNGQSASDSEAEADLIQPATDSEAEPATSSDAAFKAGERSSLGDIWDGWNGDFTFLNGQSGDGTEKHPYQISNKNQLMGLSQLAAMGMRVQSGEGSSDIIGSYDGKHFELTANIDLGGMDWRPIGFYRDSSELSGDVVNKFFGHFDGNGKTVSNFKIANASWSNIGFFGAIEDASVKNLILKPGKTVSGKNCAAILTGSMVNSKVVNCTVNGDIFSAGNAGGITAEASGGNKHDSVIENCEANVTLNVDGSSEMYAGGIAGKAAGTSIVDCRVTTGDNPTARIQGKGIVGGITGFQNDTDIYNCYVSGTIGGTGTKTVGGITGQYGFGHMKTVRFEGSIGLSGNGSAGHRGTFIGDREAGNHFRYGEDVAYLFADKESGIAFNVCGSEIPGDNEYTYGAHVGYSHAGDLYYSLVQGGNSKDITDTYFYEELEKGILSIMEQDNGGAGAEVLGYEIDHFAPNDAGRPTRGYLISIPQIDTISGGQNDYDVAVLEARGNSSYYHTIDKEHRGAVAPGKSVSVSTSPKNREDAKFQMEGVPTYIKGGEEKKTTYANGGEYTFVMPAENTEVKAIYKKVAVKISVMPSSYNITVIEERSGNRKNPVKTTKVLNHEGKLIATYINGSLEQGTQIQPVNIQAVVDTNNDVADSSVKWSIDDPELIALAINDDEDTGGYTKKSASIGVNLNASFFTDTIQKLEREQAAQNYQYPIPDTIYGAGHQNGGVAILTASTRPAASFEEKPCTDNCKVNVTFQIKDKTHVANEGASLDKKELVFTVTRKLTGNRKNPLETIQVTPPQALSAEFTPDFFDKKDISWKSSDTALITVKGENKAASVFAKADAKWIQDIIASDNGIHANNPYEALNGSGSRTGKVTVIADDMLGNRQTAECDVMIRFVTEDQTQIFVENVSVDPPAYFYDISCIKTGIRNNPVITWSGMDGMKLTASVFPEIAFNKKVNWKVSDDALTVDFDGNVTVNPAAKWIQEVNQTYPYSGEHISTITVLTEDGGFQASCMVTMRYRLFDNTTSSGGSSSGGSGGGGGSGGSGGGSSSGVSPSGGVGPAGNGPAASAAPAGSIVGTWINTADGKWAFTAGGRTYSNEWAYIHNPYAGKEQSSADWFRIDITGHMVTGWFADADGNLYYLSPVSDGTMGHMVTGWQWIAGTDGVKRRYYFNPVSDGTRGALLKNTMAPDGQIVNERGEWMVNGIIQVQAVQAAQPYKN